VALIHPTAVVDPHAVLAADVSVGAYTCIGPGVEVGEGSRIGPHCVLEGPTRLGANNHVYSHASIGGAPQDKKYAGEPTRLEIGDSNTFREFCTINRGTAQDEGVTRIGNDNWIMAYAHVAHDCRVGNHTILANSATLAGHVHIGDWVIVGGLTGVHQFCRVGAHAMTGFQSHVSQDVPPFMTVSGNPLAVHGFNIEGLRRRGFSRERIALVKQVHKLIYRDSLTLDQAKAAIEALRGTVTGGDADVDLMLQFLAASTRGIVR
jgi:UDP-N-acetylglucosamine acyltransferase